MRVRYSFSSRKTGRARAEKTCQHRKPFPKLVLEVIKTSDIIIEVLDARFIEESRNIESEELIKNSEKKIIFVFNKADLADITKVMQKIELHSLKPYVFVSCKRREGIGKLRKLIKIDVSRLGIKGRKVNVGVIGYPNTGKSSLINVLLGRASARKAAEAGFTKGIQKLKLTDDILILDTPGVIPEEETGTEKEKYIKQAKIGVRTADRAKDPEMIVSELVKEYPSIEKFYNIESNRDSEVLIEKLGRKRNFLIKGGKIDVDRTARLILKDFQEGRIEAI
ncbi:GTPase [Candidatus Woesearchaeota archaeon CG10_big_fil_rev_8_21_14_0_10_34_12]|nr:MAG: GTPase [Candidatus Woesearchaeota archaeon CG10_big_fil_rev_8_21_14_0_10_34_12]